jgi:serine protease Do
MRQVTVLRHILALATATLALTACSEARPANWRDMLREGFTVPVKRVGPAVVHIKVVKGTKVRYYLDPYDPFMRPRRAPQRRSEGLGTGVIVSRDGLIVTNHHVVGDAAEIEVRLVDGRELPAKLIGTDEPTDLAVIKIEGNDYPFAELGDSDSVEVGQWALAIGNPFGLDNTVTLGIISARGRQNITGVGGYEDFIQTDAAVNPGNSGGPLVNIDGQVIGINSAIFSRSGGYDGIAFAIPSNLVKTVKAQLVKSGSVRRAWLGVGIQDVTSDLATALGLPRAEGVLITSVMAGTPAAKAGLQVQDVITELNGRPVKTPGDLRNRVAHSPIGSAVELTLMRNGRQIRAKAQLGDLPTNETVERPQIDTPQESKADGKLGLFLQEVPSEVAREFEIENGLIITKVRPGGFAAEAGLQAGEVIVEANRKPMRRLRDFAEVIADLGDGDPLLLLVRRKGGTRFVVVQTQ